MEISRKNFAITLIILWLGHFLVDFMISLWPIYKTITHLDIATMGMIAGLCAFVGEGLQMVFGSMSDQGYRRSLIIFGIVASTSCAFLAYTQNYWILFFLFLVTCIGSGAFHPAAIALVGSLSPTRKGLLISVFATGGAAGFGCGQLVFSSLYETMQGKTAILAIPSILLVLLIAFYQMANIKLPTIPKQKMDFKGFFKLFKNRNIKLLYIIQVCNQSVSWGLVFLLPDLLISRGYESHVCLGGGHLCYILGGAAMMIPSGYLADKYSFKRVILSASCIGSILFYLLLSGYFTSSSIILVILLFMGASIQIINPLIIAFGNRLVPHSPGMVSGLLMGLALCLAEGLGQGGGGLLTRFFDEDAPAKALAILGIFSLVGISFVIQLPSKVKEELILVTS